MENNRPSNRRDADIDFSSSVNKKLRTSTRTGQACDRCKIRKIRCDSAAGGCSPCAAAQVTCKTTDRNTGRATIRGHTERLEDEIHFLKTKLQECQQVLKNNGIAVHDLSFAAPSPTAQTFSNSHSVSPQARHGWQSASASADPISPLGPSVSTIIPTLSNPPSPSNHPGLKMLMGTKVSLFGIEIDGTEFDDNFEDTKSPKSYQGVLALTMQYRGGKKELRANLPPKKEDAKNLANLFFSVVNVYAPVLDKRDMIALVDRIYDDPTNTTFESLSMPQKIMVHMIFGSVKHQLGVRRQDQKLVDEGVDHFIYCMVHFGDLLRGRSLAHVQAICCLAIFSRNYQKPEAAWFILHAGLWVAIEVELHRSANSLPQEERAKMTQHEMELRKRCFWCIYSLAVIVTGRLGKPMPLRLQDIDIEFPEEVPDFLPHEIDIPDFQKCSFRVAVCGTKLLSLTSQLYSSLYCIKRLPSSYEVDLAQLEEELKVWKASIRPELADTDTPNAQNRVHALFVKFWGLEFEFLLRHPVIRHISTTDYNAANLKACLEVCDKILQTALALKNCLCLDIQWITMAFLLAVVLTTLFIYDLRKNEITELELQKLREDMQKWDEVFESAGKMLGGGSKIQAATRRIVALAIDGHEKRFVAAKQAASVAAEALTPQRTASAGEIRYPMPVHAVAEAVEVKPIMHKMQQQYLRKDSSVALDQTPQASPFVSHSNQPFPYVDAAAGAVSYHPPSYAAGYTTAQAANIIPSTTYNANTPSYFGMPPPAAADMSPGGPMMNEWMRWTQSVNLYPQGAAQNLASPLGQEYLGGATSLVALSGRGLGLDETQAGQVTQGEGQTRMWPMNFLPGGGGAG